MPLNIRSEGVNRLAEELARRKHVNKTEAVRLALVSELRAMDGVRPIGERVRGLQERVASWPSTGLEADKAFYDSLNDEGD